MIKSRTITSIFMMPTLNINRDSLFNNGYVDAYIDDKNKQYPYEQMLYLLFKPQDLQLFKNFLDQEYERTKQIIEDYDYEEGFVVIVYALDKRWSNDFELIKESKYSKTSKEFQNLFPKKLTNFVDKKDTEEKTSLQHLIFQRDGKLLTFWEEKIGTNVLTTNNLEVWPYFNIEKETLKIEEHYEQKPKNTLN